jgi:hypothetical protein
MSLQTFTKNNGVQNKSGSSEQLDTQISQTQESDQLEIKQSYQN